MAIRQEAKSGQVFDFQILKRIFTFTKPYRFQFWSLVAIILALACVTPLVPLLIRKSIDQEIAKNNHNGLLIMLLAMFACLVVQAFLNFLSSYWSGWLGQSVIRDLRNQLYQKILQLKLSFFDETPVGRLVTRTVSDIETLNDVFSDGLAQIFGDLMQLLLIIGVMLYTDWRMTLICLITVPLMLVSTYVFKEYVKKYFNEVRLSVAALNSFVQEHITGMNIVQIFNAEKEEYAKFEKINKRHRDANIKSIMAYSIYFPMADLISALGTALIVWFGSRFILQGDMSLGTLTAFIMFTNLFFRPIRMLADRFNTLQMSIVSTERILHLLDSNEFNSNSGRENAANVQGEVEFKNVNFEYLEGQPVLKDISFNVQQGKTLAIVGATGAGKTSIINLLNRFYEIKSGQITIDQKNINTFDLASLRKTVGVVLQDVFLFSDSILNNISLGDPNISPETIKNVAKQVGAHEFIEALPGGYQYNVMERGATLSVGQRQLISFVRAIVHNPKILILDEATSSVDTETEEMIQKAIEVMMHNRTSIVIAHRLSTIQKADNILVLDKGRIVEQGNHAQLLAQKSFYAELHDMQFASV
jgi:ATP-binding cassette, subfamily B, multidrug efflux pump